MSLSRRSFLAAGSLAGLAASAGTARAASVIFDLRGSEPAAGPVAPVAADDSSRRLQAAIDKAAASGKPLRLPPGRYVVSNIRLARGARLVGVPGATILAYGGGGHFLLAENADGVALTGLVLDGANAALDDYAEALVHIVASRNVVIEDCEMIGSRAGAILLDRVGGRVSRNTIAGAFETAIQANESAGLEIAGNTISDSAGNGIRVWRWTAGPDGTLVSDNRIERIASGNTGGGDRGNGIDVFRAGGVILSGNRIADPAAAGLRVRAAANVQITGNAVARAGDTGIALGADSDGAVLSANVVDGAANGIALGTAGRGAELTACTGNLVRNVRSTAAAADEGIGIAAVSGAAITGNVVENAERIGIRL
ncbi:MAG TPA: TIGR03808 family TAT-translocated repetitive protein, partial [Kaistiaceae bacterium]|nr:TIGR03808 family TAT-translocated repetitive protein [Kaistiaceae bacterium]